MLIPTKFSGYHAGRRIYPGGKGGSSAPAPDPALIAAQIKSMGIQDDAITQVLSNANALIPLQRDQMQFGIDTAKTAYGQSQDDRTWALGRRGLLANQQDRMVQDAADFNTEDKRNELAGTAMADTSMAFGNMRDQQMRGLRRMGVNPASGRMASMDNQMSIAQASTMSTAANLARRAAREEGYKLTDRASNALAGYPAFGMANTGAGAGFGASGINIANTGASGMNSGYNMAGTMAGQMGQNASSMYNAEANYKNGQDQIAAQQSDPFGAILGMGLGAYATGLGGSFFKK